MSLRPVPASPLPNVSTAPDAERAAVGAVVCDGAVALPILRPHLDPEHLHDRALRACYEAALAVWDRGEPVNLITVSEQLRAAGEMGHLVAKGSEAFVAEISGEGRLYVDLEPSVLLHFVALIRRAAAVRKATELLTRQQAALQRNDLEAAARYARELGRVAREPRPAGAPPRPPDGEERAAELGWRQELARDDRQRLIKCVENVVSILQHDERWAGIIAWNEFAGAIEKRRPPPWHPDVDPDPKAGDWTDNDFTSVRDWLGRAWAFRPSARDIEDAVRVVAAQNSYHPVREYLEGLTWDGVPRVDRWLTTYLGVAETEYSRNVGRWWLVSAAARILRPGCRVKTMLILEGPQDLKKSTATEVLGGAWWSDTLKDLGTKDWYIGLRGVWIVELSEMANLSKHDQDKIKAAISSPTDKYRDVFGKLDKKHPRQVVFIGTVNPEGGGYLKDSTGGGRFWPVRCTFIDLEQLRRDRDQLWAEAVALFRGGARWWAETQHERELCVAEQDERYRADPLEEHLREWIDAIIANRAHAEHERLRDGCLTMDVILRLALKANDPTRWDASLLTRVGICMARLGWTARRRTIGEGAARGQVPVYLNPGRFPGHALLLPS